MYVFLDDPKSLVDDQVEFFLDGFGPLVTDNFAQWDFKGTTGIGPMDLANPGNTSSDPDAETSFNPPVVAATWDGSGSEDPVPEPAQELPAVPAPALADRVLIDHFELKAELARGGMGVV